MQKDARRDPVRVADAIRQAQTVAVCCHVNPDGDAIGSSLAVMHGLRKLGKTVEPYCQDKVPDNLMFLPGAAEVRNAESIGEKQYDLLLCVDTSTLDRMGECVRLMDRCAKTAQVDHHGTNPGYTEINDIDGGAAANCLLIHELLKQLGVESDPDIAMCLYAGISTDTGNFAFSNTGAESFSVMSELMEAGLPLQDLNRKLFRERSKAQVLLMGRTIDGMEYLCDGQLVVMSLTYNDFLECGALPEHADTLVNIGMDTVGAKMAVLGRETVDGKIKFSLRALAPYRVDEIATVFGGGGHEQAAGITMEGSLQERVKQVADAMADALNGMNK